MKVEQFITPMGMNTDSDDRALKPTECRRAVNLRSGTLEGSNTPWRENIKGTEEIPNPYYQSGDVMIGSVEDIANDAVIWFVYNRDRAKQKILRWYPYTNVIELILKSRYLNFQKNKKITHADIVDGLLYWTDGHDRSFITSDFNPPRKINIAKAKKFSDRRYGANTFATYNQISMWTPGVGQYTAYRVVGSIIPFPTGKKVVCFTDDGDTYGFRHKPSTGYCEIKGVTNGTPYTMVYTDRPWGGGPAFQTRSGHILAYDTDMYFGVDWQVLDRIKYKPDSNLSVSYDTDTSVDVNKLHGSLFQFKYRYIYDDYEKTVWSKESDIPIPSVPDLVNGTWDDTVIADNVINVWFDTGPLEVASIEIAVREGNEGPWVLAKRVHKYSTAGDVILDSNIYSVYRFFNNELKEGLDQRDAARPFDFVPQVSSVQELIEKNRLFDGDITEGYDNEDIDVSLFVDSSEFTTSFGASHCSFEKVDAPWYVGPRPDGYPDYPMWAQGVAFNDGSTHSSYPLSPQLYACLVVDLFSVPIIPNAKYQVLVHAPVHAYNNSGDPAVADFPADNVGDEVVASAIVDLGASFTLGDFINEVCQQFRASGSFTSHSAIAFSKTGAYAVWGVWTNQGDLPADPLKILRKNTEMGIVMNFGGAGNVIIDQISFSITVLNNTHKTTSFMSGCHHPFGLIYYDRAGRSGAVNISDDSKIFIPHQSGNGVEHELYKHSIRWEIGHVPPAWATHYSWAYAKNTSMSYWDYFLVSSIEKMTGITSVGGEYMGIRINDQLLFTSEHFPKFSVKPYEWVSGDRVRFALLSKREDGKTIYQTLPTTLDVEILSHDYLKSDIEGDDYLKDENDDYILDENGNKIANPILQYLVVRTFNPEEYGIKVDELALSNLVALVYRPRKQVDELQYYEFGPKMPVINPHTNTCYHGLTSGYDLYGGWSRPQTSLQTARGVFTSGDCFVVPRFTLSDDFGGVFPCENRSYSDWFQSNALDVGGVNIENRNMHRQRYISSYRWSGKKIQNTLINEISRNNALDFDYLQNKFEEIVDAREDGFTLKILQKNKPTSIFIGRAGLKQATIGGADLVTASDNVLGSTNVYENDYGSVFSSAVVSSVNYIYFYDIYNGCVVRWADNGMVPVSDYGMKKYFRDKSRALLASGLQNVNVYATFEKEYDCLILSFVDEYNSGNNETLLFHEPSNTWTTFLSVVPDWLGSCGLVTFSDKLGKTHRHNTGVRNTFYGTYYPSEIMIVSNQEPTRNKVFNSLAVHSNKLWSAPETGDISISKNGINMQSRLNIAHFVNREGVKVAPFLRDMFTSGVEKLRDLHDGRVLRGESIQIRLENNDTEEVVLFGVNVKSTISE